MEFSPWQGKEIFVISTDQQTTQGSPNPLYIEDGVGEGESIPGMKGGMTI
jgi:hypothetical protein